MAHDEIFTLAPDSEAARAAAQSLFDTVSAELVPLLPLSAEILHIGATAIPGCLTKGDLDIVVRVEQADFASAQNVLAARVPRNRGSIRTDEFAAFEDDRRMPHLGIQLTAKGGAFDPFHLFAAALRADPGLIHRYNALKLAFHDRPMAEYRVAKHAFVADVLRS